MYETFLFLYIILFIVIAKKIYLHKHTTKWHLPCKPLQVFMNLINHLASVEISLDFLKNVSDGREGTTPGVSSLRYIDKKPQIRSSDNDSTGFWPPGSLHTLGADGHI